MADREAIEALLARCEAATGPDRERIISAAILYKGLIVTLPPPARHYSILHPLGAIVGEVIGPDEQGFLTSTGRFVGRIEARDIAVQVMGIKPAHRRDLFSEDLW